MVTKDTTLNELFDAACLSADTIVQSGESFRVKDLFRGVEWSRIPKGFRTKLGSMFFAYGLYRLRKEKSSGIICNKRYNYPGCYHPHGLHTILQHLDYLFQEYFEYLPL